MFPNGDQPRTSSPQPACSDVFPPLGTASGAGGRRPAGTKTTLVAAYHGLGTCGPKQRPWLLFEDPLGADRARLEAFFPRHAWDLDAEQESFCPAQGMSGAV